jgi:hypothetical protein
LSLGVDPSEVGAVELSWPIPGSFEGLLWELIANFGTDENDPSVKRGFEISEMKGDATASAEDKEELRQLMRVFIEEARERSTKEK